MGPTTDHAGLLASASESSAAILVADGDGAIVLVNRELERQFGYAREELIGQPVDLLLQGGLPLNDADGAPDASEAPPQAASRELVGRRKDGSQVAIEVGLQPIQTTASVFVLASIVNLGERRRLEEAQRAALEEQLEFERFIAESSFQFINLPDDLVDDAIRNVLGRVCGQFGLDRSTFYRIDGDVAVDSLCWSAPSVPAALKPLPVGALLPWTLERLRAGEIVEFSRLDEIPSDTDRASYREMGAKSAVVVPLSVEELFLGAVSFCAFGAERTWPAEVVHRLEVIASVFDQVLARQRRDEAVRSAVREVQRLREQLEVENVYLRREERERLGLARVVGQSPAVRRVLEQIHQVAPTDATVLLLGETGTGKELFATYLHEHSARHARPIVRVNCAAIPATLIESELFGRERGAFTGALARQIGRFELADRSTIFLDEIGDLPPDVQVKLLRVLEERTIERLGNPRPILIDTRIIAATHRNLEERVAAGTFREDLYYRLNVFPIQVPPLRERAEDIPLLLWRFVEEFSKAFGKRIDAIDKNTITALQQYPWPGNIRELRNVVERAIIVTTSRRLTIPSPQASAVTARRSPKLIDVEKEHIRGVLESTGWRIRGSGGAADRLGMKPTTLETRMAKLGLRRTRPS